eukprot:SAG11_NODE_3915_length_2150_cov_28.941492_2_plen_337_part_00
METESEEEEEYHCGPTPLSLEDKTFDDMCCPNCGSNNAVAKVFKCRMSRNAHQKGSLRIDPRVKAMISLCTMHHVSQVQTEPLVCGLAKLLGRSIERFPKCFAQQQILREIGIGAKAELCAQLLLWLDECGPQTITACIDAASIGEDKYEGIAFVRKYFSEPHNPRQPHVFKRIALGLIDLVEGTDINKHVKILELMQDCINCYNFVHEPPRPMTLLHMALLVGYTCNDHAESTVPNRFFPWIRDVLVSEVGTPAHYHQVHCLVFKLSGPPGSRGRRAARHAEWSATADLIMREANKTVVKQMQQRQPWQRWVRWALGKRSRRRRLRVTTRRMTAG